MHHVLLSCIMYDDDTTVAGTVKVQRTAAPCLGDETHICCFGVLQYALTNMSLKTPKQIEVNLI